MDNLLPKGINKENFYNELSDICLKNEKHDILMNYKESLNTSYTIQTMLNGFFYIASGAEFMLLLKNFSIPLLIGLIIFLIGVVITNKFINNVLEESETVIYALRDQQYALALNLLATKYKETLSNNKE